MFASLLANLLLFKVRVGAVSIEPSDILAIKPTNSKGNSINEGSANLPMDFLRESLMNFASFDEVLKMRMVNREFYNFLAPYYDLKEQCGLENEDVWPPKILQLHDIHQVQGPNCLNILGNHSRMYEEAIITVPMIDPSLAIRFINALNPRNSLTIIFPDYHDYKPGSTLKSINSSQFRTVIERIEENPLKTIKIEMT